MFKNISIFNFTAPGFGFHTVETALERMAFAPCGPSQERSVGWVPPRGDTNGSMVESIGDHWILKLQIETKAVPASVLKRKVDEMAANIEQAEGRKPGKKERKEIQENALLELLPMAFAKQSAVLIWIDLGTSTLVLGTTSTSQLDLALSSLVECINDIEISRIVTQQSPSSCMAEWLISMDAPYGFSIDRECELKSTDENKATVRYAKHALDIAEVRQHIEGGKVPTKLAMTWEGRVSFLLTETMQVKKLDFLEGVFENTDEKDDKFDADVAISTGELGKLIPSLIEALGGESDADQVSPARAATENAISDRDSGGGKDSMYDQSVEVVLKNRKASISLVQRHLKIGYNRAARLLVSGGKVAT